MLTDKLTRYSANVEHGEVHHEPDADGMWVMCDDVLELLVAKPVPAASGEPVALVTASVAMEALDNLDDYARMPCSVDPIGARTTLERFIAQQPAPAASGEPVALVCMSAPHWMTATAGGKVLGPSEVQPQPTAMLLRDVPVGTKLYAAAQPAPALVPLTEFQLAAVKLAMRPCPVPGVTSAWLEEFARAIEAAHGITVPD